MRLFGISLFWLALLGCKALSTGAKENFSQQFSCPSEQISVEPRAGLQLTDVTQSFTVQDSPSEEVRKDPARLKLWRENRQNSMANINRDWEVFAASGCGHSVLMACRHPQDHQASYPGLVSCVFGAEPQKELLQAPHTARPALKQSSK